MSESEFKLNLTFTSSSDSWYLALRDYPPTNPWIYFCTENQNLRAFTTADRGVVTVGVSIVDLTIVSLRVWDSLSESMVQVTLTDRQRDDLYVHITSLQAYFSDYKWVLWNSDRAILTYLQARNLDQTAVSFKSETSIELSPDSQLEGLLEKKWTAVIRLQKKVARWCIIRSMFNRSAHVQVMDLEKQIISLQEELRSVPASRNASVIDWVPKSPARFALPGHRDIITRVAFHPVISLVATASEDTTIRIWDWESGVCERTLKGHTKGVKDVDFDLNGRRLGNFFHQHSMIHAQSTVYSICFRWSYHQIMGHRAVGYAELRRNFSSRSRPHYLLRAIPRKRGLCRQCESWQGHQSLERHHKVSLHHFPTSYLFWQSPNRYCVRTITAHDDWVRYVVPSEDSRFLASCSADHVRLCFASFRLGSTDILVDKDRSYLGLQDGSNEIRTSRTRQSDRSDCICAS